MAWKFWGKTRLTDNIPVQLTPTGKQKADKMEGEGAKFQVMAALAEDGGMATIREISETAHMSVEKVSVVVKQLIISRYVQVKRASQGGGEE